VIEYNVRVEYNTRQNLDDQVLDALVAYHPATGRGPRGHLEVELTLPATDVVQAVQTAVAVAARALDVPMLSVEAIPTDEFDRRLGVEPIPELLSVTEAASTLHVTRQAILQRIESGSLPATRVGNTYVVPSHAVQHLARPIAAIPDENR